MKTETTLWAQKSLLKNMWLIVFVVDMIFWVNHYCATRFLLWCTFLCVKQDKSSRLPACKLIYWIVLEPAYSFSPQAFELVGKVFLNPFVLFDSLYKNLHLQEGTHGGISGLIRPAVSKPPQLSALVQCNLPPLPLPLPHYTLRKCKCIQEMIIHSNTANISLRHEIAI